ncbi:MAG: hypothetical protein RLZZ612_1087 [Pseudomonadota bacterium]
MNTTLFVNFILKNYPFSLKIRFSEAQTSVFRAKKRVRKPFLKIFDLFLSIKTAETLYLIA